MGSGGGEEEDKSMSRYNRNNGSARNTLREHLKGKSSKK